MRPKDGILTITGKHETLEQDNILQVEFTLRKGDFRYGRIQIRAKIQLVEVLGQYLDDANKKYLWWSSHVVARLILWNMLDMIHQKSIQQFIRLNLIINLEHK